MKKQTIKTLANNFEAYTNEIDGIEFWFARDLQKLLGYVQWRNFKQVIEKAEIACKNAHQVPNNHFAEVSKTIAMPKGAAKGIKDLMLTRYACYLIAQNGDPRKEEIAFAMNYFAVQTRKQEILEKRIAEWERLQARVKLSYSEKELSEIIYERQGREKSFSIIRSKGDKALFGGYTTRDMKIKLGVPKQRPLADFLPTITIKAKDFANEITVFNVKKDETIKGEREIAEEHIKNNEGVRGLLIERGIKPEELPPEEDIQKLKRRVKSEGKKILKDIKKLKKKM